ncbi:MAG: M28 family peptidase [Gemmatimonadota bacterium]|nr:MAG: M28 family peptidase [Gemmatimonadota bacterium]
MTSASSERLRAHVCRIEGERHPQSSPEALKAAAQYIRASFEDVGLLAAAEPFSFQGASYDNIVAVKEGEDPSAPRVLIGAHYDSVRGTSGADDNASGVAALLEAARLLTPGSFASTIEFVAFNLEENQGTTYRVGSRHHASEARRKGIRYAGALVLEMVGYTDSRPDTQRVPKLIAWKRIPRTADFLAVTADGRSKRLLNVMRDAAADVAPDLSVVLFRTPFRGWLVWQTRLSDNASFWSQAYPSVMITDTAFLRNPHYHMVSDTHDTLDYAFMAAVTDTTVEAARRLAVSSGVA